MKRKLTKQEKKDRKEYLKTCKKYKKELINIVKKYGPWDNFLGAFFDVIVRHWKDYYKLGYNVWGVEIKDTPEYRDANRPTRYEIACEMERRYNEWENFTGCDAIDTGDGRWNIVYFDKYILPDGKIDFDLVLQDKLELKKKFFDYYMEYANDMWD